MKNDPESLVSSLMAELEDDYVGLWLLVKQVRRAFPEDDPHEIRSKTLSLIWFLLQTGSVEAGFPSTDRPGFVPWTMKPYGIVSRIAAEWKNLGRDPTIGEVVWFTRRPCRSERQAVA
jgi:hypothetical protein